MRTRTAVLLTMTGIAAASGAVVARRRLQRFHQTGSLAANPDLSGAPFGPHEGSARRARPSADARVLPPAWEPPILEALADWTPSAPRHPALRALAYLWAAPLTLAGLLAGLGSGVAPQMREGVLLFARARGVTGAVLQARGFQGAAIGHVVVTTVDPGPALLAHELTHVRQSERLGPLNAPIYLALLATHGYNQHPMERAARKAARLGRGAPA